MSSHGQRHHHHGHQRPEYVEEYCQEERVYAPEYEGENGGCAYERTEAKHAYHNNYQRNERLGELGAAAAGAFSLYEGHEAKVDPAHAAKHRHEEEAAALGALGSGGYAYYEHRKKEAYNDRPY